MTGIIVNIFKPQMMEILKYKLVVLPPFIPRGCVLFSYNRILNFNDCNIVQEVEKRQTLAWSNDLLFELLIVQLDRLGIVYQLMDEPDFVEETEKRGGDGGKGGEVDGEGEMRQRLVRKICFRAVRNHIKKSKFWALYNYEVFELPKSLLNSYNNIFEYKTPDEYIKTLVQRSNSIRNYLRLWVLKK